MFSQPVTGCIAGRQQARGWTCARGLIFYLLLGERKARQAQEARIENLLNKFLDWA